VEAERGYTQGELVKDRIAGVDRREGRGWPAVPIEVSRTHARAAGLALACLVLVAIVVRVLLTRRIQTPWIMVDELIYSELAKSFSEHGRFLIRDVRFGGLGVVYPVAIAPAWLVHSMAATYGLAKTLNAVMMSLAAVPAYFWARRLVSPALSVLAAALTLLLPAFVYTGTLMTENAFLPAFGLAAFTIALALERPTLWAQALALGACALATGVRVQGVVLFAVLALATGVKVMLDVRVGVGRPRDLVRPYVPMLAALVVLGLGYVGLKLAEGADLASGLGAYSGVTQGGYSWSDGSRWVLHHAAELSLAVGVVPLAALGVLAGLGLARGLPGAAERAFVAVATSALVLVVTQVGVYASRFSFRIEERNMIALEPILLLALIVWIGRGLPRPPVIASVAAIGSAALLLTIPLGSLLNVSILSDTFGLIPLLRLRSLLSGDLDEVRWITIIAAVDAALAFLVLPRRIAAVGLPLLLAGYFALGTNLVLDQAADYSRNLRDAIPAPSSWIDERIGSGASASYLFGAGPDPEHEGVVLWQLEFWNRRLESVYNLGAPSPAGLPELNARIDRATGRIVSDTSPELARARYVVAEHSLALAERPLREVGESVLYSVRRPLQVRSVTQGVYPDSWTGSEASYDRYVTPGQRGGSLSVLVSRAGWTGVDKPGRVVIEVGPLKPAAEGTARFADVTARRTWTVHSGAQRSFFLPTPPPPFRATVHIDPTFSPADYGQSDTRQLGAVVTFTFKPVP
jgi:hypothetical protein